VPFILQTQSSLEIMDQALGALAPIQALSSTAKQVSKNFLATRMPLVAPFQKSRNAPESFLVLGGSETSA